MSKENNIDRLFRDGLSGYSETPPTHVWDSINSELKNKRKQKMILLFWKGSAAAAFIGIIILAGIMFHSTDNGTIASLNKVTDNNIRTANSTKTEAIQKIASNNESKAVKTNSIQNETLTSKIQSDNYIHKPSENKITAQKSSYLKALNNSLYNEEQGSNNENLELLENKNGITPTEIINPSYIFFIQNKDVSDKHFADAIFEDKDKEDEVKSRNSLLSIVSVGGQISPSYSYRTSNQNEANNESGITKINGGVHLNLKASKRFHVETGVLYSQLGQNFSNSSILVANSMLYGIQNNSISFSNKDSEYQNSMGNIEIESSNSGIMYDAVSENSFVPNQSVSTLKSTRKYDIDIQQVLEYIEIPFILKYDIINKGIALSVNGGVSTNLLVGNNAYQLENNNKSRIGSINGINSVSYSASFGLGMRTPISSSFDFNFEPRIKYFINSITNTSGYDYKPYSMGLLIGFNYKF